VVGDKIVVDRLRCMDELARARGATSQQLERARRVVAADIHETARIESVERLEDLAGDPVVWLVARRAQPGVGRVGAAAGVAFADPGQIHDITLYQAANAVAGTENAQTRVESPCRADRAAERLVDHGGGTAALRDDERPHRCSSAGFWHNAGSEG